jgi:hypothetical protein
MVRDPSVETWRSTLGQSTSARLRQTQRDLAASQADLTRVEAELHDALRRAADLEQVREELRIARFRHEGDLADIQDLTSERDGLVILNAELKAEVATWRAAEKEADRG